MTRENEPSPTQVKLTHEQIAELKDRITQSSLSKKDVDMLVGLLSFNLWLQERLSKAKLSIKRLRQLFGFKTESRKKSKKDKENNKDIDDKSASENGSAIEVDEDIMPEDDSKNIENKSTVVQPKWNPKENHGRYGANDYPGCPPVDIPFEHELLKEGKCPHCAECGTDAKLYSMNNKVVVLLEGRPLITGNCFNLQKARCSLCQAYFTAPLPAEFKEKPKYSASCLSSIAIAHYYAGQPFKRIEMLQSAQGVPLPDSTQHDLMKTLYETVAKPIVAALRECASHGTGLFFDDTPGHIIEQVLHNKNIQEKKNKKSVHATALMSEYKGHRIYLFDTNTMTAGKQFKTLISKRTVDTSFTTMTDASASNFSELEDNLMARWVISLCLSHGRRRFFELLEVEKEDSDIQFILDLIARVYQHERHCKTHQFSDQQRLEYHQQHSQPIMDAMRTWFNNLILHKQVEPNSRLGQAISYMLKRWTWLTQFLRVPGAALDNNLCEQAIKVLIRYRKNSLFYRTFYGASIGDAMMSLLQTAVFAGINVFDYLNTLQAHAKQVQQSPQDWLPWAYQQTLVKQAEKLVKYNQAV